MFTPSPLRRTLPAALRDLRSEKPAVRASAARDLAIAGQDDPRDAADAVEPLTRDSFPEVREAALFALGALGARHQIAALEGGLADGESRVRQSAAIALGEVGGERAVAALERAASSESADVRFQSLMALAATDPRRGFERALGAVSDGDAWIEAEAATQLGDLLDPRSDTRPPDPDDAAPEATVHFTEADRARAREALRAKLDAASGRVAVSAALALARLGDARGHDTLLAFVRDEREVLGEDSGEVRLEAIERLGEAGGPGVAEALAPYAWKMVPSVERAVARAALARLGDARAQADILTKLRSMWGSTREGAVRLAGAGRVREAVPELARLLASRRVDPFAVIDALEAIGDGPAREALALTERDERCPADVRDAARVARSRITEP